MTGSPSLLENGRTSARIVMRERPTGLLELRHFERLEGPIRALRSGEVLVENTLVSVAPAARALMQTDTYRPRLIPGETIPSTIIGRVVATADDALAVGTRVAAFAGWEEYSVIAADQARVLSTPAPPQAYLGLLGQNGLTAYFGMLRIGEVSPGQTVVVSGAAGGVGHLAGQIARIRGARVVGITSSAEKNDVLTTGLGFHEAVDRRSPAFPEELAAAVPDGVDVYFDTTGGPVTEHVFPHLNLHGRIVCCGTTADYEAGAHQARGPAGLPLSLITRRLRLEGFLVGDFRDDWEEATSVLRAWSTEGMLVSHSTLSTGLDSAPAALLRLLTGGSVGQSGAWLLHDPAPAHLSGPEQDHPHDAQAHTDGRRHDPRDWRS